MASSRFSVRTVPRTDGVMTQAASRMRGLELQQQQPERDEDE